MPKDRRKKRDRRSNGGSARQPMTATQQQAGRSVGSRIPITGRTKSTGMRISYDKDDLRALAGQTHKDLRERQERGEYVEPYLQNLRRKAISAGIGGPAPSQQPIAPPVSGPPPGATASAGVVPGMQGRQAPQPIPTYTPSLVGSIDQTIAQGPMVRRAISMGMTPGEYQQMQQRQAYEQQVGFLDAIGGGSGYSEYQRALSLDPSLHRSRHRSETEAIRAGATADRALGTQRRAEAGETGQISDARRTLNRQGDPYGAISGRRPEPEPQPDPLDAKRIEKIDAEIQAMRNEIPPEISAELDALGEQASQYSDQIRTLGGENQLGQNTAALAQARQRLEEVQRRRAGIIRAQQVDDPATDIVQNSEGMKLFRVNGQWVDAFGNPYKAGRQ